ncbi:SDR family oxidoreductase [Brevundimonas sp.]|uniref:SDR family oxidoreductase n=1 Tax=Brevundimonas sp. TaxID=1871086 RepID=UPI0025C4F1DD|nr:SDR family oxidoreductase [Brevundimonas sp.]
MIAGVVEDSKRPIIACVGNCQSGAIRAFLMTVPEISRDYDVVLIYQPTKNFEALRPRVRAVIQQVTHGWDDFRLTEDDLPADAVMIRYPAMLQNYLWPQIPFQKRRIAGDSATKTKLFPYTICDDLVLRLVGDGVSKDQLLDSYFAIDIGKKYPLDRLHAINAAKAQQLDDKSDFGLWDQIESGVHTMRTANHPGGGLMAYVLEQIVERLPLQDRDYALKLARARARGVGIQNLDAPIHPAVANHFGLNWAKDRRWSFWHEGDFTFEQHLLRLYDYGHNATYWAAREALKRKEDATALLAQAVKELPESTQVLKAYIAELARTKRLAEILQATRRLHSLSPTPSHAVKLASALRRAGEYEEANRLLNALDSTDPNILMALAQGLTEGTPERIEIEHKAAEADPDNLQVLLGQAKAHEDQGELAQALATLERAAYVSNWATSVRKRQDALKALIAAPAEKELPTKSKSPAKHETPVMTSAPGPAMKTIQQLGDLTGRVCVVTGGAGHIGRAIAEAYLESGAAVVLLDRAFDGSAHMLADSAWDGRLSSQSCDLSDEDSIYAAAQDILMRHPTIDVLVHNAGFVGTSASDGWVTPFETQSPALFRAATEINLVAPFILTQALLSGLQRSAAASVINVGSIYGLVGPDWGLYEGTASGNPAGYAASKGGLMQLTRWMATSLGPHIRVNALCPGGLERGQDERFQSRYVAKTPLARMATPEDFKGVALFLGSDLSAYVTGQVLAVDGGWTAW